VKCRASLAGGATITATARLVGVHHKAVRRVMREAGLRASKDTPNKSTAEVEDAVRASLAGGETKRDAASLAGVSETVAHRVKREMAAANVGSSAPLGPNTTARGDIRDSPRRNLKR
jgi:transposase-like protein